MFCSLLRSGSVVDLGVASVGGDGAARQTASHQPGHRRHRGRQGCVPMLCVLRCVVWAVVAAKGGSNAMARGGEMSRRWYEKCECRMRKDMQWRAYVILEDVQTILIRGVVEVQFSV